MPAAAAQLAEILPRHAGEAVLPRLELHPFQQQATRRLLLSPFADRDPGQAHALGEIVANPLELGEIEQARLGGGAGRQLEATDRIGGHERVGKLALELCDLASERSPGGTLGDLGAGPARPWKRPRRSDDHWPEQLGKRHSSTAGQAARPAMPGRAATTARA